jgi:acetyltransferase-like isoleucine patch superfamily enzyme
MLGSIAETAIVRDGVTLQDGFEIQDFVVIGIGTNTSKEEIITSVGSNALIRSHSVIYFGNQIGKNFQTGHGVLIRELNKIGDSVSIGSHSVVEHHVNIGSNTRIHSNVFIPEYTFIDENVWIGPNVVCTNATYPANPNTKTNLKGPVILQYARIGANSTILPGVKIGRNSLVGAGSVVTHDVPDGKVVAGNPAKEIRDVSEIPDYEFMNSITKPDGKL